MGPGTFRPVEVDDVRHHARRPERFDIPEDTAAAVGRAREQGRRVVAVGTTATRALESALGADGRLRAGAGETDLVIVPGFRFRVVDALVTNFHLPRSSLLLLVSAFAGRDRVLAAYARGGAANATASTPTATPCSWSDPLIDTPPAGTLPSPHPGPPVSTGPAGAEPP